MTTKSHFGIVTILISCCNLFAGTQTDPNNWIKLNLSSTTIARATVYYEKSFEPNLPFFEEKYNEFLAEKSKGNAFNSKKDQILADINSILGISEPDTKLQNNMWTGYLGFSSIEMMSFLSGRLLSFAKTFSTSLITPPPSLFMVGNTA